VAPDAKITELADDEQISNITLKSENVIKIIQAPTKEMGTNVAELPKAKDNGPVIFERVEIEAKFPGGPDAWRRYLSNKLDPYTPINDGAPEGTYTVIVRFVVSVDGMISNIVAETKMGYGMEQEAIKVIKNGPKWIPAQQNGIFVNAVRRQPITFIVQ
jgi:periplasmic protein TonB